MTHRSGWRSMRRGIVGAIVAVAAIVALPAVASLGATEAAWTDAENARATPTAGTLVAPTNLACSSGVGGFTMTWTQPAGGVPGGYTAVFTKTNGANAGTTYTFTQVNGTNSLVVPTLLGGTGTYTLTFVRNTGGWSTTPVTGSANVIVLGLTGTCSFP